MTMGTQNTVIATNLPSFPWNMGDKLDAIPLNNILIQLQNQINYLVGQVNLLTEAADQSGLGVTMTVDWGGNTSITAGPYVLTGSAPYGFTVVSMDFFSGTNGGSFLVTLLDNGVPYPGLSNILVSGPQFQLLAPAGTQVNIGDQLSLSIAGITGFPINAWVSVNGTTNVVQQMIQGVTTGAASGTSLCIGVSAVTFFGQGIATSLSTSTASGIGMGFDDGAGVATGTSAAVAHGISVMTGSAVGLASGTSAASAIGSSTVTTPNFILDDPNFGQLDINPLL